MLGAVWYGAHDLRIEDVPRPEAGPGEVVLAVARNGICGSDLHTYVGSPTGGAAMHVPGVVLGHEFSGTVVEIGDELGAGADHDGLRLGSEVAVAPIEYCGSCFSCRRGHPNTCRSVAIHGGYRRPLQGGLAPFVAVSRRSVFAVPTGLSVVEAALAEPTAVAVHAVRRAPELRGQSALIVGAGPIGLTLVAAANAAGAAMVLVSEPSARRREAAARLGADVVIDPGAEPVPRTVRAATGDGVDVAFDTSGVHAAFNAGVRALRPRGAMVSVAGWQEPAHVDMGVAMAKEIDLRFTMTYEPDVDFPAALDLLASRAADPEVLISDHVRLVDVVELGLERLLHHGSDHLKILVDPTIE